MRQIDGLPQKNKTIVLLNKNKIENRILFLFYNLYVIPMRKSIYGSIHKSVYANFSDLNRNHKIYCYMHIL